MGLFNTQGLLTILNNSETTRNLDMERYGFLFIIIEIILIIAPVLMLFSFAICMNMKQKRLKVTFFIIGIICAFFVFLPLYFSSWIKLRSTIENKLKYEIVTLKDTDFAVLSTTDGKELIAECTYDKESSVLNIHTNKYQFIDAHSGMNYRYVLCKDTPTINSQ